MREKSDFLLKVTHEIQKKKLIRRFENDLQELTHAWTDAKVFLSYCCCCWWDECLIVKS